MEIFYKEENEDFGENIQIFLCIILYSNEIQVTIAWRQLTLSLEYRYNYCNKDTKWQWYKQYKNIFLSYGII